MDTCFLDYLSAELSAHVQQRGCRATDTDMHPFSHNISGHGGGLAPQLLHDSPQVTILQCQNSEEAVLNESMISQHSTIPVPDSLCRRLEILVLPFTIDTSLSSLMTWNLQSYTTTVLNERMWFFLVGVKIYTHIFFSGSRLRTPRTYARAFITESISEFKI